MKIRYAFICFACFLVSCSDKVNNITTGDEAKKYIQYDYPVVASATNFFCYDYEGDWDEAENFVRFEVPNSDIIKQIAIITAAHNHDYGRTLSYSMTNLSSGKIMLPKYKYVILPWWHPEHVRTGFFVEDATDFGLQIWADTNNGTLFIHQRN
jgi:hypothetical protein